MFDSVADANAIQRPCPICGGTTFKPLFALRDNRTGAFRQRFQTVRCLRCDLVGLRPLPREVDLDVGYQLGYGPYPCPSGGAVRPKRSGARKRLTDRLRLYWHFIDGNATVDRVKLDGRILDVGANQGDNVEYLLGQGHDVVGLEPNPRACAVAKSRGLPVVCGTLESASFEPNSFDTVILSQVVEHLPDPVRALDRTYELLRPHGRVVVFTPNVYSVWQTCFGKEWAHWHVPYHVYLYGAAQLRALLTGSGFKITRLTTVTPTYWLTMSQRLWRHNSQSTGWTLPAGAPSHTKLRLDLIGRLLAAPLLRVVDLMRLGDCLIAIGTKDLDV